MYIACLVMCCLILHSCHELVTSPATRNPPAEEKRKSQVMQLKDPEIQLAFRTLLDLTWKIWERDSTIKLLDL